MADYQFSLLHELNKVGRMEYRSFGDDTAAMHYAEELIGDFEKVTVLEGVRIVGVVWHPSVRPRG